MVLATYDFVLIVRLLDGNPDAFASVASRFHGVDESMQPEARVYHHALELVLPNENAALRVVRIIACLDMSLQEWPYDKLPYVPSCHLCGYSGHPLPLALV